MLYDANFLQKLDTHHEHTYYVRIQALTFDERPLEQLEGRITSGSINLDGKSAIRRSCSLSFIAEATEINDYYLINNLVIKNNNQLICRIDHVLFGDKYIYVIMLIIVIND